MLDWLTSPFKRLRLSAGSAQTIVLPNKGNAVPLLIIFGGLAIWGLINFSNQGKLLSLDTISMLTVCSIPNVWILSFIKAQTVVLSETSIRHSKLGFFRLIVKEFAFEDIDYWKFDQLTLVVVLKGGKAPKLPHGPFADLSKVMLIPRSLYMPRTKEITDYLTAKGVRKRGR